MGQNRLMKNPQGLAHNNLIVNLLAEPYRFN